MTLKKRLLPVLASVSLFAAACGGASDTAAVEEAAGLPATAVDSHAAGQTQGAEQLAEVLAVAIQSVEDTSYSFTQGVQIQSDLQGQPITIGSEEAFITGQVDGGESAINADIGTFMRDTFESMGLGAEGDPFFEGIVSSFDALQMSIWTTEDTIVLDLSDFGSALALVDPSAVDQFEVFSDGPVSVDIDRLAELSGLDDVSASDLATQFGGAQVLDPGALVTVLSSIDALEPAGTDSVNGIAVDVYDAEVALAEYAEALGQEGLGDLGGIADLGDGGVDADSVGEIEVEIELSVDAEGLVRQILTSTDTGGLALDGAAGGSGALTLETWQTFDDYGQDFDIVAPDAVDVTDELAGELGS